MLLMIRVQGAGLLKDMIDLFGGLRFRYIILYDVDGTWLLLEACAKTKIVTLNPADPVVGDFLWRVPKLVVNNFSAKSSLRNFNLSRFASGTPSPSTLFRLHIERRCLKVSQTCALCHRIICVLQDHRHLSLPRHRIPPLRSAPFPQAVTS